MAPNILERPPSPVVRPRPIHLDLVPHTEPIMINLKLLSAAAVIALTLPAITPTESFAQSVRAGGGGVQVPSGGGGGPRATVAAPSGGPRVSGNFSGGSNQVAGGGNWHGGGGGWHGGGGNWHHHGGGGFIPGAVAGAVVGGAIAAGSNPYYYGDPYYDSYAYGGPD